MATGRTTPNHQRVYINGYDLSGYAMDSGEQGVAHEEYVSDPPVWTDAIVGVIAGKPTVTFGPLVGVFDNTATVGLHVLASANPTTRRNVMLAQGIRAAPAVGDPVFCAPLYQTSYKGKGEKIVSASMTFAHDTTSGLVYDEFWGNLLHTYSAEGAANSSNTPNVNNGAATAAGGWMMYQVYTVQASGTATISIDDSANGTSWTPLASATTAALPAGASASGIIQLATNATVRQYLRWQLALAGGATSAHFALAFMRGR